MLISEVFPAEQRAAGQTLGAATHWSFAAILTLVFPWMADTLAPATIFAGFCGMMLLQLVWVVGWVPETKGVALADMAALLRGGADRSSLREGTTAWAVQRDGAAEETQSLVP